MQCYRTTQGSGALVQLNIISHEWDVLKHSLTRLTRKWPFIKELLSHKIWSSALRKRTYHVGNGIHIYQGDGSGYLFNNVKVVGMIFVIFDAGKKKRHLLDSGNLCPYFFCFSIPILTFFQHENGILNCSITVQGFSKWYILRQAIYCTTMQSFLVYFI